MPTELQICSYVYLYVIMLRFEQEVLQEVSTTITISKQQYVLPY